MSVMKFKGHSARSGQNVNYIMRDSACEEVSFHNLEDLEGENDYESKTNARSYAYNREEEETKGRTHYRMVLSWEGKEESDKAREMAHEHLKENFPDARAIVAVHQDTDQTHAHIWIDARKTDDRKVHSPKNHINELSRSWQNQCDREYGTDRAHEFAEKREEMRQWREDRHNGKDTPKPERHQIAAEKWREKDQHDKGVKNYGIEQEGFGGNQRPFEVRNSNSKETERAITGSQQRIEQSNQQIDRTESEARSLHQTVKGMADKERDKGIER